MKKILQYIAMGILLTSCAKDYPPILDLSSSADEIKRIELRADHKTLLPNGVSKMEFYPIAYGKKSVESYGKTEEGEYYSGMVEEEYVIPSDQLPKDCIKVYDNTGKEILGNVYSTTTDAAGTVLEFYAKGNNVESNRLPITIRPLPDESYEELVVPVVFHMLIPPTGFGPTYEISKEYLEKVLKEVNDIFNRRITTDPNGGNLKVTFKLALYNPSGGKMQEAGKNVFELSEEQINEITSSSTISDASTAYKKFILNNKSTCIWDPGKYLNIWLTRFSTSLVESTTYSFKYLGPNVMHSDYDLSSIPGLKMTTKDQFTLSDITDCLQVGCLVNYMRFLNPAAQGTNAFSLANVLGGYYGLLSTNTTYFSSLKDGDIDYCEDTYTYYSSYYPSVYKANNLSGQPDDRPYEWFTSFNVMDVFSRKNSISVDQTLRMRAVLKQCPSRWAYKSDFAFTGRN